MSRAKRLTALSCAPLLPPKHREFIIQSANQQCVVIAAAHCSPHSPPADGAPHLEERSSDLVKIPAIGVSPGWLSRGGRPKSRVPFDTNGRPPRPTFRVVSRQEARR